MLLKRVEEDIIQPSIGLFTDEAQQSTTFDGGIGANSEDEQCIGDWQRREEPVAKHANQDLFSKKAPPKLQ